jgi:hypothetical protein
MEFQLSPREKIKLSALVVNSKLDKYIKLHNLIFKKQATLVSFIKNLLGFPPPFKQFLEESLNLRKEWESTIQGIIKLNDEITKNLPSKEKEYLTHLLNYAMVLYKTTSILCKRQEAYYQKSLSNKNSNFEWSDAKQIEEEYNQSINEYLRIGEELNRLNYIIFG